MKSFFIFNRKYISRFKIPLGEKSYLFKDEQKAYEQCLIIRNQNTLLQIHVINFRPMKRKPPYYANHSQQQKDYSKEKQNI